MKPSGTNKRDHIHDPLEQHRGSSPSNSNITNPIAVVAEDYDWKPRGPPLAMKVKGDNLNLGSEMNHLSLKDSSCRVASSQVATPTKMVSKRFKQEDELVSTLQKAQRTKSSRSKKIEKNAAKAAAQFYGECFLEGVGISHADKAARESHRDYKKWWLQEFHDNNLTTSLGDAYNVPIFNPPPKNPLRIKIGEIGVELDRKVQASLHVVDDSDYLTPSLHTGGTARSVATASHQMNQPSFDRTFYAESHTFDRASGARAPSPDSDEASSSWNVNENRTTKKRQRSLSSGMNFSKADEYYDNNVQSKPISIIQTDTGTTTPGYVSENATAYCIDPNATTDDEVPLEALYSSRSLPQSSFQIERKKRLDRQRRESTYSETRSDSQSFHSSIQYQGTEGTNPSGSMKLHHSQSDDEKIQTLHTKIPSSMMKPPKASNSAKLDVIRSLAISGGDVTNENFLSALEQLRDVYTMTGNDARLLHHSKKNLEGNWLSISRPHFPGCLGTNSSGEYMYTLGRLSFDMFAPANLICSISGTFNRIKIINPKRDSCVMRSIPKSLREEVEKGESILRRYDIVTTFKIEPDSPMFGVNSPNKNVSKLLKGTITTYGYVLPDPTNTNRLSIWFSGGRIEPNREDDEKEFWIRAFGGGVLKRHLQEKARILAAKLLLGAQVPSKMEDDGSMEFELTRPIGGHGSAYVDVLYLDENLRIVQGHKGSLFVFTRVAT